MHLPCEVPGGPAEKPRGDSRLEEDMRMIQRAAIGLVLAALCRAQEGTAVFVSRCVQDHDPNSESHAPLPEALGNLPWQDIVKALETGSMQAIGAPF